MYDQRDKKEYKEDPIFGEGFSDKRLARAITGTLVLLILVLLIAFGAIALYIHLNDR